MEIFIAVFATGVGLVGGMFVIWRGYQVPRHHPQSSATPKFPKVSEESSIR